MILIKSLRPCKLIITDAGIKLSPGQVVSVPTLSPQTENLIKMGHVAKLEDEQAAELPKNKAQMDLPLPTSEAASLVPKEYENLHVPDAIEFVSEATDIQVLKAILKEEKRKTVLEAVNQRLSELEK